MAISGKIPYGIDQRIGAGVVEAVGNFHVIGCKLITQFQQLERLLVRGLALEHSTASMAAMPRSRR